MAQRYETADERDARIAEVVAEVARDLASWMLARQIGESDEVVREIGFLTFDKLGAALGISPDGDAARAIVSLVQLTGEPRNEATRMRVRLDEFMAAGDSR